MCADVAAESEDRGEVDLEDGLPVVVWELVRWVSLLDAAAVEQDVDSVAVLQHLGKEGRDRVGRGQVGGVDGGLAVAFFDLLLGGLVGRVSLAGGISLVGRAGRVENGGHGRVPAREECQHLLLQGRWPWPVQCLWCRLSRAPSGPRARTGP